jgi:hypothetical protein
MSLEKVFNELLEKRRKRELPLTGEQDSQPAYLFLESHMELPGSNRGNPGLHKDVKNRGEKMGVYFVSRAGKNEAKGFRFLVRNKTEWMKWRILQEIGMISHVHFFLVDPIALKVYTTNHQEQGDIGKYYLALETIF